MLFDFNKLKLCLVGLIVTCLCTPVLATEVQDLVKLKSQSGGQGRIVGMGLVVGLNGTGDGKLVSTHRSLAALTQKYIDPYAVAQEMKDAKNVALVTLTAKLPAGGVREGDSVDVYVSAVGAKSLEGGRLFLVPMTGPLENSPVFAFAEGPIVVEDEKSPTNGVVRDGAQLTRDVLTTYVDRFGRVNLVIEDQVASFPVAKNLTALINAKMAPDGPNLAKAVGPKNILVQIPKYEQKDPVQFISDILETTVDPELVSVGARVVINERTGTIIMTGNVQISPVIITHENLLITTVTPEPEPNRFDPNVETKHFAAIDPEGRGGANLQNLLLAFDQLKVPVEDRIEIIVELHETGYLHAELIVK